MVYVGLVCETKGKYPTRVSLPLTKIILYL